MRSLYLETTFHTVIILSEGGANLVWIDCMFNSYEKKWHIVEYNLDQVMSRTLKIDHYRPRKISEYPEVSDYSNRGEGNEQLREPQKDYQRKL